MKIILGNSLEKLKELEDNSIDSIVTDPPYELGFMGKKWDNTGIANNVDLWAECLRVLKPGGHLLAFSGTRTYHRMAVAIEDAGFEVRDMIEWVYGSGFPKSLNIGKAIDKRGGENIGWFGDWLKEWRKENNIPQSKIAELFPSKTGGLTGCVSNWELGNNLPTNEQFNLICETFDLPFKSLKEAEREYIGTKTSGIGKAFTKDGWGSGHQEVKITKGKSEWEGWGTALKPAHEPICMARKPLAEKNVANNVLKWGTGGINIDESRVDYNGETPNIGGRANHTRGDGYGFKELGENIEANTQGRFPANLIHDNSEEVRECFPESKSSDAIRRNNQSKNTGAENGASCYGKYNDCDTTGYSDSGSASRFFKSIIYNPKASKAERNKGCEGLEERDRKEEWGDKFGAVDRRLKTKNQSTGTFKNHHPTVKPIALMEYLIKMVTPKSGTVLDPFMGSGSTGVAAKKNGYDFIGIDMTPEYIEIAKARINATEIENRLI